VRHGGGEAVATVETVRGPIDTDALGPTLVHEHVFNLNTEIEQNLPSGAWDEEERVADAITKLNELKGRGIDTIVDPTVIGLGRYIPRIQRVAAATDLNIVAATGIYTYNDVPFYFHYRLAGFTSDGVDPIVGMFVRDITEGIGDTGVKAAILKCVTEENGLTPGVERILRATARAHRETGAPITTHTHVQTHRGRDQQRVFKEEGVDLERVIIGHSGDSTDLDYLRELMDNGSFIGMDRFGLDALLPFDDRVDTVVALCAQGYAGKMVLSHDASCFIDWFEPELMRAVAPNWHFTHISDEVLPALKERGVTEDQIDTMFVQNPRRIFETVDAY
jgi:phosphotriesterase-related protein